MATIDRNPFTNVGLPPRAGNWAHVGERAFDHESSRRRKMYQENRGHLINEMRLFHDRRPEIRFEQSRAEHLYAWVFSIVIDLGNAKRYRANFAIADEVIMNGDASTAVRTFAGKLMDELPEELFIASTRAWRDQGESFIHVVDRDFDSFDSVERTIGSTRAGEALAPKVPTGERQRDAIIGTCRESVAAGDIASVSLGVPERLPVTVSALGRLRRRIRKPNGGPGTLFPTIITRRGSLAPAS